MGIPLDTLLKQLPADERTLIEARAAELIAEEMTLRDLRKARDLTQERIAEFLNVGQDSVSRLEQRSDLLLSTLRSYVKAMGGKLDLVVQFPDRPPVIVAGLAEKKADPPASEPKRTRVFAKPGKRARRSGPKIRARQKTGVA